MIDPQRFASNLEDAGGGLWVSRGTSPVAYPERGYDECFQLEDGSFWFRHRNRVIAAGVATFPPPGFILDVGAGNGFVTLGLRAAGFEAVALEAGREATRNALGRGLRPVICATLEDAGLAAASIPAIGLFDVLEHIEDDLGFLQSLTSRLVPHGRLYLTVPAFGCLWSNEDVVAQHYRRYRLEAICSVVRRAGMSIRYATYFFLALAAPILVLRSIPSRLRLRKESDLATYRREHGTAGSPFLQKALRSCLDWEVSFVRRRRRIPLGASCLVIAERD